MVKLDFSNKPAIYEVNNLKELSKILIHLKLQHI